MECQENATPVWVAFVALSLRDRDYCRGMKTTIQPYAATGNGNLAATVPCYGDKKAVAAM